MEDYNYDYYCSLILRDIEGLEKHALTFQKDVERLIKKGPQEEAGTFLFVLPLIAKVVEIVSLIPHVKEQLIRENNITIKEEEEEVDYYDDDEWVLQPRRDSEEEVEKSASGSRRRFTAKDSLSSLELDKKIDRNVILCRRKRRRRVCTFNTQLQEKFAGVIVQSQKEGAPKSDVTCLICSAHFSIGNSGISQILLHLKSMKHRNNLRKKKKGGGKGDCLLAESISIPKVECLPLDSTHDSDDDKNVLDSVPVRVKLEEGEEVCPMFEDSSRFDDDNSTSVQEENDERNSSDSEDNDGDDDWIPHTKSLVEEDYSENDDGGMSHEKEKERESSPSSNFEGSTKTGMKRERNKPQIRNQNTRRDKRRKCKFNPNLQQQFRGVIVQSRKEDASNSDVTCLICGGHFSIANSGSSCIKYHLKTEKHIKTLKLKMSEGSLNEDQIRVSECFSSLKEEPTSIPMSILTIIKEIVDQQESRTAEWEAMSESNQKFVCPQCPKEHNWDFKKQIQLNLHIRRSHPSPYFQYTVMDEPDLIAVREYFKSLKNPPFTCPICKLDYEKKLRLESHLGKNHSAKQDKHENLHCTACGKQFGTNYLLKSHLLTHGPRPYSCSQCQKTYPTQRRLGQHISSSHRERSFLCSQCGASFPTKQQLQTHILGVHEKVRRFKCDKCPETFIWGKALLYHKQKVHLGVKTLCSSCGMLFTTKYSLRRHLLDVHENPGPFPCDLCSKTFKHKRGLRFHRKSHERNKDNQFL